MSDRELGKVKWFNNARGYGFIVGDSEPGDVFVHFKNIRGKGYKSLCEGQAVEYERQRGAKGYQAEDVTAA